jgi:hypothetical protein
VFRGWPKKNKGREGREGEEQGGTRTSCEKRWMMRRRERRLGSTHRGEEQFRLRYGVEIE